MIGTSVLGQTKNSPQIVKTFPEAFLAIPGLTLHSISFVSITTTRREGVVGGREWGVGQNSSYNNVIG